VHRIPTNGAYSAAGVKNVKKWIGKDDWDVIHFNFGLWDWYGWKQAPRANVSFYVENMEKIVKILKTTDAKLIFGTTTPPCDEAEHKIKVLVSEEEAQAFNDAAVAVMKKHGVAVNDLYACISADRKKYTRGKADVHWNEAGSKLLGKQVAKVIGEALAK
jgi:acyl-CoA thioesterase-1